MKLRVATSIVFSECTTPFGRDVVPEVKITIDGSSGSRPAMRRTDRRARRHRWRRSAASASAGVAVGRGSSGVRCEHDRRLGRGDDVAHLGGTGARRRDHHQRAEPQHRVDRDDRHDVVAGEHEHRVVGRDALALQRGDRRRRRAASSSPYVSDRPRSASATRCGSRAAASRTRSTGSVPQCPAARNRGARPPPRGRG